MVNLYDTIRYYLQNLQNEGEHPIRKKPGVPLKLNLIGGLFDLVQAAVIRTDVDRTVYHQRIGIDGPTYRNILDNLSGRDAQQIEMPI